MTKLVFASSIKFHENLPSESRVVPYGRTDRHDEASIRFPSPHNFVKAPTNQAGGRFPATLAVDRVTSKPITVDRA
jgi:hypothetical protein